MATMLGTPPSTTAPSTASPAALSTAKRAYDHEALVGRIRAGDPAAVTELYNLFRKGIRLLIGRQLGWQDVDDRMHEMFVLVLNDIQRGAVREPSKLVGYICTVTRRHIANQIGALSKARNQEVDCQAVSLVDSAADPEQQTADRERTALMRQVLARLSPRDRNVLFRFYVLGQNPLQIQAEMQLSERQFRLLKWRAKSRFADLGKRKLRWRARPSPGRTA